jgi:hypothetical protein
VDITFILDSRITVRTIQEYTCTTEVNNLKNAERWTGYMDAFECHNTFYAEPSYCIDFITDLDFIFIILELRIN